MDSQAEPGNQDVKSLTIAREGNNSSLEAGVLINLGRVHRALGQHDKAVDCHEKSLATKREAKDPQDEGTSLNNLGLVYYRAVFG